MPRAVIRTRSSSGGRAWPSPSLIHRDTAPSRGILPRCPCDGLVLGDARMSRPYGESRVPDTTEPGPSTNPMAMLLLEDPVGTGAHGHPDLRRPPRASVLPKPPTTRSGLPIAAALPMRHSTGARGAAWEGGILAK